MALFSNFYFLMNIRDLLKPQNLNREVAREHCNFILLNNDYIALIKNLISDFENNNPKGHVTVHIRLETHKCVIRGKTIKYCSSLKTPSTKKQSVLESKLDVMKSNLLSCDRKKREEILNNINHTQNNLNKLIEIKTKGATIGSRARWMESGKKNTKYFLHFEKMACRKNIYQILTQCSK